MARGRGDGSDFKSGASRRPLWDQDIWKETQKAGSSQLGESLRIKYSRWQNTESKSLKFGMSLACSRIERGSGWSARGQHEGGYKGRPGLRPEKLGPREVRKPLLSEMGPELLAVGAVRTQCSLFVFCEDILYLTGRPPISGLIFICLAFKKPVLLHQLLWNTHSTLSSVQTQFRLPWLTNAHGGTVTIFVCTAKEVCAIIWIFSRGACRN